MALPASETVEQPEAKLETVRAHTAIRTLRAVLNLGAFRYDVNYDDPSAVIGKNGRVYVPELKNESETRGTCPRGWKIESARIIITARTIITDLGIR